MLLANFIEVSSILQQELSCVLLANFIEVRSIQVNKQARVHVCCVVRHDLYAEMILLLHRLM